MIQVLLLLQLTVDEEIVSARQHHEFGKRLTCKFRFLESHVVHTCVTSPVTCVGTCGLVSVVTWTPLVQTQCFVTTLTVLPFHKIERDTDCLVTIVEVHIDNLLVVVDDRENTRAVHTRSPTTRETDGMVWNTGGVVALSHNVRSPMCKRECMC